MNMYIELVKKWLKDKDSVSLEELEANKKAADAAYAAADAANTADAAYAAADAADAANTAWFAAAANAAAYDDVAYDVAYDAAHWVKRYEELTK